MYWIIPPQLISERIFYFRDKWNFLDSAVYLMFLIELFLHIAILTKIRAIDFDPDVQQFSAFQELVSNQKAEKGILSICKSGNTFCKFIEIVPNSIPNEPLQKLKSVQQSWFQSSNVLVFIHFSFSGDSGLARHVQICPITIPLWPPDANH